MVDHDAKRLVWAAPGRDKATLRRFFDALGADRSARITHVTADGADWIADVVSERCPTAVLCADPYHLVSWITDALDEVVLPRLPADFPRDSESVDAYFLARGPIPFMRPSLERLRRYFLSDEALRREEIPGVDRR